MRLRTDVHFADGSREGRARGLATFQRVQVPDPPARSWSDSVAGWLPEWRERWGAKANAYCAEGISSQEAGGEGRR